MMKTIFLSLVPLLVSSVLARDAALQRPALVYKAEDRAALLKRLAAGKDSFEPTEEDRKSADVVRRTLADFRFEANFMKELEGSGEDRRSDKLLKLAVLMWLDPKGSLPKGPTYAEAVAAAAKALTIPGDRVADYFPEKDGDKKKAGPWARFLDSGVFLWSDALAFDLLSSDEVKAGGLDAAVLDQIYSKLSDGILHGIIEHLRTYTAWQKWGKQRPIGNNWNSREFAGAGMALLAMRERLSHEPESSHRRKDFDDGVALLRTLYTEYLEGWGGKDRGDGAYCYYYEGPHYLRYWVEYSLALGVAWDRAFPDDKLKLLDPEGPIARFCRADTLCLAPTHRSKEGAEWSCIPIDDTWTYPEESFTTTMLSAAWINFKPEDRALLLNCAKRAGGRTHPLLLANPILEELNDGKAPAPLPLVAGIQHNGVGVARTSGDSEKCLTVFVKNFDTPLEDGKISLSSHSHADNSDVVAYRNGEPILVVPGYGHDGYANKAKTQDFTHWEHHNTLCLETGGKYEPSIWKDLDRHDRLSRAENVTDALGEFRVLEMATPKYKRTVVVVDASTILILDRLEKADRIKLCWWGNGSVVGRENSGGKSPQEGDADKIVTAKIDTTQADGIFFRGPSLATHIRVVAPAAQETKIVDGEYGPRWYATNYPLSGMHVVSKEQVKFALTVVEITEKKEKEEPVFQITAEAVSDDSGALKSVLVHQAGKTIEYHIAADGKVERSSKN